MSEQIYLEIDSQKITPPAGTYSIDGLAKYCKLQARIDELEEKIKSITWAYEDKINKMFQFGLRDHKSKLTEIKKLQEQLSRAEELIGDKID